MITRHYKRMAPVLTIAVTAFLFLFPANSHGEEVTPVDTTVQHLLDYVARSDLTFIRNSGRYTAKEASEHMNNKYEHFRDKIQTPEEFITLCATRSMITGKPYRVINEQGETVKTSEWLNTELDAYRNGTEAGAH